MQDFYFLRVFGHTLYHSDQVAIEQLEEEGNLGNFIDENEALDETFVPHNNAHLNEYKR